ncbi:MAG TPA: bifunctional phosphoribosylaminoimidazolecarboxamide formyltransferase/IMP cyclohydrolase [Candidatus Kapabacteria bacterium]|nr:bifunctional phosphoribosylaminoimidazolecarboxamide formyltransferase/IMP cyclohydrolase [Candidatus Kapabacteria bacterium]
MAHSSTETPRQIDRIKIKRALLSVFYKDGLEDLAKSLTANGVELYSTGGTEKFLRDKGFAVRSVSEMTGFPEVFDGRVKTLHPLVHGGLLYRRELESHEKQAREHGVEDIDMLVVNLYPFFETMTKPGSTEDEIIEQIDIGGPAMLRSAAKNFKGVAVLTTPRQYQRVIEELGTSGELTLSTRKRLATEAFALVGQYDVAIANFFAGLTGKEEHPLLIDSSLVQPLRYGENPHQSASLYGADFNRIFTKLWGKELSFNNILDISASMGLMNEFFDSSNAVASIIKHNNPCGVAEADTPLEAFNRAFTTDPESPFGGIINFNREVGVDVANRINEFFSEVILAPGYTDEALEILKKKKDRRLLTYDRSEVNRYLSSMQDVRSVIGGMLVQDIDRELVTPDSSADSITKRALQLGEKEGLDFAWKIVKHVKSNAIVYAKTDGKHSWTLGIGGGQTSRVEASRIAVEKAKRLGHDLSNSLVASDAFFPFADGLIAAVEAGAVAAIQPGGSVRDQEVITAAEERNISLVMTGMRHFKH